MTGSRCYIDLKEDPRKCRPVTLTSSSRKVVEKVILRVTESHLKNKVIIKHSQYGFTNGKSCLDNSIFFYKKVTCLVNEWKAADIIFLDFSAAIDTVPHSFLLKKMSNSKINRFTLHWMIDWLDSRAQNIIVNGAISGLWSITSSIPQASILGPVP